MKKSVLVSTLLVVSVVLFSGCSSKKPYSTKIGSLRSFDGNEAIASISIDQDSTTLGFLMVGSVVRTNYLYSLAAAAQTTKDRGFKYFSMDNTLMQEQFNDKEVENIQDAYDACAGMGFGTFGTGLRYKSMAADMMSLDTVMQKNNCDDIVTPIIDKSNALAYDYRVPLSYRISMHNNTPSKNNKQYTFNAEKVLKSDLLDSLNKEYYKENKHE